MRQESNSSADWSPDVSRVSQEIASRLRARNISVSDSDTPDEVMQLSEAVERFERAVEERGGDLMVDEPPSRGAPQPDDARFLLPTRAADESVAGFLKRLDAATAAARTAPSPDEESR
jgi:hypothetical protein